MYFDDTTPNSRGFARNSGILPRLTRAPREPKRKPLERVRSTCMIIPRAGGGLWLFCARVWPLIISWTPTGRTSMV